MNHFAALNPSDPQTWSSGLIAFAAIVGVIGLLLLIVTIVWFVTWIKYSWMRTTNSANLTGGQISQLYLARYGVDAKRLKFRGTGDGAINSFHVESRYFYLNPYIVRNNTLTLRLVPWTYHRTSIYTLAMALESTWTISSSKSSRFNSFWWDFSRKISLIVVLLPLVFAALFALAPVIGWSAFISANSNAVAIVFSVFGALFLILYSASQAVFYARSRKEVTNNLRGILLPTEIRAIGWIFQVKFIYYLIRTIYEVLRFILQIIILIESDKK